MPLLIEALRSRLIAPTTPPRLEGDHDFGTLGAASGKPLVPAAVLVAVVERPSPTLLLTTRTAHLRNHGGQVAFPGGRIDPEDRDAVAAALREAEEEIGLAPQHVEIVGVGDPYQTGTGYHIAPVVGLIPPGLAFSLSPHEVVDTFEVPLAFALDPANQQLREAEWKGEMRRFYVIEHDGRTIWGATAGILVNLSGRLISGG